MKLVSLKYSEFEGDDREWNLNSLTFDNINLIVARNATGKSRTLRVIDTIAKLLSGKIKDGLASGRFDVFFVDQNTNKQYSYHMELQEKKVISEILKIDDKLHINRQQGKIPEMYFDNLGDKNKLYPFQPPESEVACAKRDALLHPYLRPLYEWAEATRLYDFSGDMGKSQLAIFTENGEKVDDGDPIRVVAIFNEGRNIFKDPFVKSIITDMQFLGYNLSELYLRKPYLIKNQVHDIQGLVVQECDLPCSTDQLVMSSGMFSALSLIIHINYLQFKNVGGCVLIDDIGEGLDFERSCSLVNLLRQKAKDSNFQLIMTTNDRFIMNAVPLDEWSVLSRNGNHVAIFNYQNSKEIFDEFKFTGLNNFDFLATDFINSFVNPSK